jgi:hypothetical protein
MLEQWYTQKRMRYCNSEHSKSPKQIPILFGVYKLYVFLQEGFLIHTIGVFYRVKHSHRVMVFPRIQGTRTAVAI